MNKYVLTINKVYDSILNRAISYNERLKLRKIMHSQKDNYYLISKHNGKAWLNKWSVLGSTNTVFYKYYSSYIGEDINIVPDDLMHNVIEPILNPMRYRGFYADKNMFDILLESSYHGKVTPLTIVRCINSCFYDTDYSIINENDAQNLVDSCTLRFLVAKPTIDTSSGKNVVFIDKYMKKIDLKRLRCLLGSDFILQEALTQSEFMSQFNKSSVNTLRLNTYKSVKTNEAYIINGVLRVGKAGSYVDNTHAGGCLIGIEPDGCLKRFCTDQYGHRFPVFNGIDFSADRFVIPEYEKVKSFAKKVADSLPHQRCLALDIALDVNNNPILIEYNIGGFGVWAFQQTIGAVFGPYTDEVISYCKDMIAGASRIYTAY